MRVRDRRPTPPSLLFKDGRGSRTQAKGNSAPTAGGELATPAGVRGVCAKAQGEGAGRDGGGVGDGAGAATVAEEEEGAHREVGGGAAPAGRRTSAARAARGGGGGARWEGGTVPAGERGAAAPAWRCGGQAPAFVEGTADEAVSRSAATAAAASSPLTNKRSTERDIKSKTKKKRKVHLSEHELSAQHMLTSRQREIVITKGGECSREGGVEGRMGAGARSVRNTIRNVPWGEDRRR